MRPTSGLNLLDAHVDHNGDEGVLSLDQRGQVDSKHPLHVLHVWHTVIGHLLRALLVGVEPTVYQQQRDTAGSGEHRDAQ